MTRRQEIAELLKKGEWTPKMLAEHFMCELGEIIKDLEHVRRSVHPPLAFRFDAPVCRSCGFVFKERLKMKTPSKCPKCRGEDISEGKYSITER